MMIFTVMYSPVENIFCAVVCTHSSEYWFEAVAVDRRNLLGQKMYHSNCSVVFDFFHGTMLARYQTSVAACEIDWRNGDYCAKNFQKSLHTWGNVIGNDINAIMVLIQLSMKSARAYIRFLKRFTWRLLDLAVLCATRVKTI